jgi:hypothetical protein
MARTPAESRHTPDLCAAAYEALLPRIEAVEAAALLPAPPDVRAVVRVALETSDLADEEELRARFARLPAEEFSPTVTEALRETARAMRHMLLRRDAAEGQGSGVLLDTRARRKGRPALLSRGLKRWQEGPRHDLAPANVMKVARRCTTSRTTGLLPPCPRARRGELRKAHRAQEGPRPHQLRDDLPAELIVALIERNPLAGWGSARWRVTPGNNRMAAPDIGPGLRTGIA